MGIIAIDFDGTIVSHMYPNIGVEVPNAFNVMKKLIEKEHKLMLWTMRDGRELDEAVAFCERRGVSFWGVNCNPSQASWSNSTKQFAHLYIDDAALGCPVMFDQETKRNIVNWKEVEEFLTRMGYFNS